MKMIKSLFLVYLLLATTVNLFAQSQSNSTKLTEQLAQYQRSFPTEKLYLSFDKPYYNVGDTVWFKSILLNGNFTHNQRSDKIYVELFNDSCRFIENRVIALNNGLGYGDFELDKNLAEGTYTIRAYSNWQQNFGSSYFFQKSFYVGNVNKQPWLIDSYQKLNNNGTTATLDLKLRLRNLNNEVAGYRDVEVYLMNGQKRVMRINLQTNQDGIINTQVPLASNRLNEKYAFYITDKKDNTKKAIIPLKLQNIGDIDLQFMPEGGYMVNNIYGKVAFKAIGVDGLGKMVNGKIVNSKNEMVAQLQAQHKGMGSFYLLPQKNEAYTAIFEIEGREQRVPLPQAKDEGTTLRIESLANTDTILVYLRASETKRSELPYQLFAQMAEETIFAANVSLKNGFSVLKLPKSNFSDGIIHFTLFAPDHSPINERQVFINHQKKINLALSTNKELYKNRDSIALQITATKEDGSPLSGSFSVAVTDDQQVKMPNGESNIISYFLLQNNLKGNIEEPGWYFANNDPSTLSALDNLLLTQGWVGYQWKEIFALNAPKFKAEKDNTIEGRLTNLFKKPVPNIRVMLLSLGKNPFVTDTMSNAEGRFIFKDLPLSDSVAYTIKIKNAKGKTATANISVDEFKPAMDISEFQSHAPWYINADSTLLTYYKTAQKLNIQKEKEQIERKGTLLKEVEIKGNKRLKEIISTQAWDANFFKQIDEEELKKTPQKSLLDLLKLKITGFTTGLDWYDSCSSRLAHHNYRNYVIGNSLVSHFIIDKVNTHIVNSGSIENFNESGTSLTSSSNDIFNTNTTILSALTASDITNITVYKGCANYYIDVTTRSGRGPWISISPGVYVFRPLPLYLSKEFYSPNYSVSNTGTLPDLRSTIYWNANVVTDENGKAMVSFYAADKPTSYTIKVEGTDLLGRFGYQKGNIKIVNKTESK